MFGKIPYGFENMNIPSESITKKLSDPNTTLDDLLKEEELLQEIRNKNKDLIKYFNKEKVKEMLDYITKEQVDEINKGYKFPFLCSQIFGLEIEEIMKYFFITNKQMEELEKKDSKENNDNKEENKDNNNEKKEEDKKEDEKKENTDNKKEEENKESPEVKKEEEKKEEQEKKENEEEKKPEDKPEEKSEEKPEEKNEEEKKEETEEKNEEENPEENSEEKSEPESTENKIEVLDYFFNSFFPEDESVKLNYVLCGYFSSLINNLLSMNPITFLKYIYLERNEFLNKMVEHSYRKSISDTLSKIIHFENYIQNNEPLDEKTKEDMIDTRKYLLTDIFDKIDVDMDNEDLNSIFFFITGLFDSTNMLEEKPIFEEIINNKKIIKSIITKPFHDLDLVSFSNDEEQEKLLNRRKNFSTLIDMILFFLKNIKKLKIEIPTNTSESKLTIKHTKISDEIFIVMKNLIQNNFIKKNENEKTQLQCFNDYQLKPLGEYKIKIIELLTHLIPYFKNISKFYDEILIEVDFFKTAFEFLLQYEWNNLYQEAFLNLLKTLLDYADDHQTVQEHLINTIKILDLIQTYTNLDNLDKFNFTQTQDNTLQDEERETLPIKHGYYSFFISLSYKLNTVMGGTPVNIEGGIPRQGSFNFMKRVPEEGDKKAAMDMLYGGFMDEPEEKNEVEEEQFSYKCMEEFINDQWREFFGMNIESVIKQFEDKNWPKIEKKDPFKMSIDGNDTDKEVDLLNMNNESEKDKNLFGDNNDNNDNNDVFGNYEDDKDGQNDRRGGVFEAPENNEDNNKNEEDNPFYSAIKEDNFDFGNEQDKKNNDINNNNFANENDFEFGDDNKDKDNNNENNEKKDEKNEDVKNEENKDENKEEDKKEDNKEDINKNEEVKKEENKEEIKTENNVDNKEVLKNEEIKTENKENAEENQEKKTE